METDFKTETIFFSQTEPCSKYHLMKDNKNIGIKSKIKYGFGERNGKEGVTLTSNPRRNAKP